MVVSGLWLRRRLRAAGLRDAFLAAAFRFFAMSWSSPRWCGQLTALHRNSRHSGARHFNADRPRGLSGLGAQNQQTESLP
jgi:hypothetical protein